MKPILRKRSGVVALVSRPSAPLVERTSSGFVLITTLVFLIVITILVLGSMRGAWSQERIAGNLRDRQLAVAGADVAVRTCEADVGGNYAVRDWSSACVNGYCSEGAAASVTDWKKYNWSAAANKSRGASKQSDAVTQNAVDGALMNQLFYSGTDDAGPRYFAQKISANVFCPTGSAEGNSTCKAYRCVGHSQGLSADSESSIETVIRVQELKLN